MGIGDSFPEWIVPMAATLTQERFTGPEWIFERKLDGIRLLAYRRGRDVRLFSRNRLPQDVPRIAEAIAALPVDEVILDGEVTWDPSTRDDERARSGQAGPGYHVFDIMWLDGRDLTALPLEERRAILAALPLGAPPSTWRSTTRSLERACAEGWRASSLRRDSYEQLLAALRR